MHDFTSQVLPQTKTYTSANDIIEASDLKSVFCNKHPTKHTENVMLFRSHTRNVKERKSESDNSEMVNVTQYVTSERYHKLNKKSSDKSVIRSTSTFFYDLDSLAKRHSFHCTPDVTEVHKDLPPRNNDDVKNFKSEAIVQECATQIKPKLLAVKNLKENKKTTHKAFPNDTLLSSEIFLRDHEGTYVSYKSPSEEKYVNERHQKFWSFAKYRTEQTNPISSEKKIKKKDRGKRTEDPCPCQLFSYACPCTNTKSLTELAKNSKSLTVADEVTSTPDVFYKETKCNKHKNKKLKDMIAYENKRTSTVDIINKKSKEVLSNELNDWSINSNMLRKKSEVIANPVKIKGSKKTRQVLCPNCKEMINILSTTEEGESVNSKISPFYQDNELPATPAYTYQDSKDRNKIVESRDICNHEPQCELVPVCQILPTDNVYVNQNMSNKTAPLKPTPRVIRVTKGCRHHPPCTVVPSCQRFNVLNNNCEYIPPCLHRPRCVNLPLCAPLSKSIYYDETIGNREEDINTECLHMHHTRCMPCHQNESIENQINRVQNTCEYLSECSPRFVLNSTLGCISPIPSPCEPLTRPICKNCKSEKSCQYDFSNWKQDILSPLKQSISNEDVVYIRDVGCQFRNKNYSPKDSIIQYKASSESFNMNVDRYCANNYHTLRYEDKFTLPISPEELSVSTVTLSSTEIDSQCPTHGKRRNRDSQKIRSTGFVPKPTISPFVAYTNTYPNANFYFSANANFKEKLLNKNPSLHASVSVSKKRKNSFLVKSRSSFLKGKYKNILRRTKKSRTSHQSTGN